MMKRLGLATLVGIMGLAAARAHAVGPLWWTVAEATAGRPAPGRALAPGGYGVFALDRPLLNALLAQAPVESAEAAPGSALRLSLPLPDGRLTTFDVESSPVMAPVMQARFPEIRTFKGQGVTDPTASVRFDLTPRGLHARIVLGEGTIVIDPWGPDDIDHYVSYHQGAESATVVGGVPALSVADAVPVLEGNSGTTPIAFSITLTPASTGLVTVIANTADGTATVADSDYVPILNQTLVFNPGETMRTLTVSAVGDLQIEGNETFSVVLSNPIGAVIADGTGVGTIINDDFAPAGSLGDLVHDSRDNTPLPSQSGNPRPRVWTINQEPHRSYEVIVDGITGDAAAGVLLLQRLASDGVTVLQSGGSVSGGSALSLRFKNTGATPDGSQFIRLVSAACGTCDLNDTVRVRAYETTYRVARYNNSATQVTVLVVANSTSQTVSGEAVFLRASDGAPLGAIPFTLQPHATLVSNTAAVPGLAGTSGSILIANDAPFGAITGKAVAVEPATGFTFDTAMVPRAASTKMVPRDN